MKKTSLFFLPILFSLLFIFLFIYNETKNDLHSLNYSTVQGRDDDKDDGMQKAMFHEFLMTRDPALDVAPTERLVEARKRMDEINSSMARATNASKVASLNWQERGPNNIGGRTRAILIDKNDA